MCGYKPKVQALRPLWQGKRCPTGWRREIQTIASQYVYISNFAWNIFTLNNQKVTCTLATFEIYLGLLLRYLVTLLQGLTVATQGTRKSNKPLRCIQGLTFFKAFSVFFLRICYTSERKTGQLSPPSLTRGGGKAGTKQWSRGHEGQEHSWLSLCLSPPVQLVRWLNLGITWRAAKSP